jgi:hypothetical protein
MTVSKIPLDIMTVDRVYVKRMPSYEMSLSRMTVGVLPLDEMTVDKMSFNHNVFVSALLAYLWIGGYSLYQRMGLSTISHP